MSKILPRERLGSWWVLHQPSSGHLRIACSEPCAVAVEGRSLEAVVWNVSALGVYLMIEPLLAIDAVVTLTFALPGENDRLTCTARVIWQNPASIFKGCGAAAAGLPPGVGLAFVQVETHDRERIEARIKAVIPPP